MERIIQAKVLRIEKPQSKTPEEHGETTVVLQCPLGEIIDKRAKVTVRKAIFKEQDTMIVTNQRIKVRGTGKTTVKQGDTVEVRIISNRPE
jgi:hypothetical protein